MKVQFASLNTQLTVGEQTFIYAQRTVFALPLLSALSVSPSVSPYRSTPSLPFPPLAVVVF